MHRTSTKILTIVVMFSINGTVQSQWRQERLSVRSSLCREQTELLELKSTGELLVIADKDSAFQEPPSKSVIVLKETGYGALLGVGLALPGALVGGTIGKETGDTWTGLGSAYLGAYIGYVVGCSLGVHSISKDQNPNLSYLGTLASTIVGSGIGIGTNLAADHKGIARIAPVIFPLVASIIYAEVIDR